MDNFDMSEYFYLIYKIGWVQFVPTDNNKVAYTCEKCCLKGKGKCGSIKCCSHERLDERNGYYEMMPENRIKTVKKLLSWFGL